MRQPVFDNINIGTLIARLPIPVALPAALADPDGKTGTTKDTKSTKMSWHPENFVSYILVLFVSWCFLAHSVHSIHGSLPLHTAQPQYRSESFFPCQGGAQAWQIHLQPRMRRRSRRCITCITEITRILSQLRIAHRLLFK